jgi:glyceraldehyde-3-phosphate dehydrogenase (NAD(P))
VILWTANGTKDIRDFAESTKFSFKDTNMIHVHGNMTKSIGDTVQLMYSDDQTGIVIPENHMLLQAMLFQREYNEALNRTQRLFNMDEKKKLLEDHFSRKH